MGFLLRHKRKVSLKDKQYIRTSVRNRSGIIQSKMLNMINFKMINRSP